VGHSQSAPLGPAEKQAGASQFFNAHRTAHHTEYTRDSVVFRTANISAVPNISAAFMMADRTPFTGNRHTDHGCASYPVAEGNRFHCGS
jgi:hypothetical protein